MIIIFSGTTEGRLLSSMLCENGIEHFVSVATDYGKEVMSTNKHAKIHVGRMDRDQMQKFFSDNGFCENDIVVDATHPYAKEVSKNIEAAARAGHYELIRVKREDAGSASEGRMEKYETEEQMFASLDKTSGNILLATGTNLLKKFKESVLPSTFERTFVRILPSTESIDICVSLGVKSERIIAMQGPFSHDMNKAMFQQYSIANLVTKDGGISGGFTEKITAASELGVRVFVLKKPENKDGVSVFEAFSKIAKKPYKTSVDITLAGFGPGGEGLLSGDVKRAVAEADAVFGAKRLVKNINKPEKYEMYLAKDIIEVLKKNAKIKKAVVLFSGDTGFYSGAKKAYAEFKDVLPDSRISILPGISSVSLMAAMTGECYDDASVISVHGKNDERSIDEAVDVILKSRRTFCLVSDAADVSHLAKKLTEKTVEKPTKKTVKKAMDKMAKKKSGNKEEIRIFAGCDLSYENGRICEMTLEEAENFQHDGIITLLFINDEPVRSRVLKMRSDTEFLRSDIPMTKEVIRHESLIRLDPREGDIIFDIGGGTGSVAIEAASLEPSLTVTTIEKNEKAAELIEKNIEKLGLHNITVIKADAKDVLRDLPCPDRVFIGGSGGNLTDIVSLISSKGHGIRYVVTAVSLETISDINTVIDAAGAKDVQISQIAVSDINAVGSHHMMKAQNPVTIFSFTI